MAPPSTVTLQQQQQQQQQQRADVLPDSDQDSVPSVARSKVPQAAASSAAHPTAEYPAVSAEVMEMLFTYGGYAQAAYTTSKTWGKRSLDLYGIDTSNVLAVEFMCDRDDPLYGDAKTDTEMFGALLTSGEVILGFRGTETLPGTGSLRDWLTDFVFFYKPITEMDNVQPSSGRSGARVHCGFLRAFNAIASPDKEPPSFQLDGRPQDIRQLIAKLRQGCGIAITKITCVGHSLGGALATLAAFWCKKVAFPLLPVNCFTYGSPRVGNAMFAAEFEKIIDVAFRVTHKDDIVPTLPPAAIGFSHVGQPVLLCQPAIKDYGLGRKIAAAFMSNRSQYIAAAIERPFFGLYIWIPNHFVWDYMNAMASVMRQKEPNKTVLDVLMGAKGVFNALTLLQRVLVMHPPS